MKQVYILTREDADKDYTPTFIAWYSEKPTAETLKRTILKNTGNDDSDDTVAGLLKSGSGKFDPDTDYVLRLRDEGTRKP